MMSDIRSVMKFECLPNEILIECLEYLNGFEIFYAVDQLNYRLSNLIYNMSLHIDFRNLRKPIFDRFCAKVSLKPELINRIHSIKLSNEDECFQCNILLSLFSINEFSQLRKFEATLPSVIPFGCWEGFQLRKYLNIELVDLLFSNLQILSITCLDQSPIETNKTSSIIHLTTLFCNSTHFNYIIRYLPLLKYLHIKYRLSFHLNNIDRVYDDQYAIYLKKLIIGDFKGEFESFELLIKQTPNLENLTISTSDNIDIIDAHRWEHLVTIFLPHLNRFKFKLSCSVLTNRYNLIVMKFEECQTEFWLEQHHWYTEYVKENDSASIYTVPYPSYIYHLRQSDNRHYCNLMNNINTFVNVTDLKFYLEELAENCQYHFPNVTSLTLCRLERTARLTAVHIEYLRKIVDLSNLKHLSISSTAQTESSFIFHILKEASQVSSISIDSQSLRSCFKNNELCTYFNKIIKRLYQNDESLVWYDVKIDRFCEIFSNIEHLQCNIDCENDLLFLFNHLPKLSTMKAICGCDNDPKTEFSRLEGEAQRMNMTYNWYNKRNSYFYKYGLRLAYVENKVFIWMDKNMT